MPYSLGLLLWILGIFALIALFPYFAGGLRTIWALLLEARDGIQDWISESKTRRAHKGKVLCQHEGCTNVATRYMNGPWFYCDEHVEQHRARYENAWWLDHTRS